MLTKNYFHIVSILVSVIAIFVIVSNLSFAENNKLSGGILDSKVNSDYQDYGAYLIYGTNNDTLFFTSSRPIKHKKKVAVSAEMFFSTRPAKYRFSPAKLKKELDNWGLFEYYQDRFFNLFKRNLMYSKSSRNNQIYLFTKLFGYLYIQIITQV